VSRRAGGPALRAGPPDAPARRPFAFLPNAAARGSVAFLAVAAIGQALAFAVWMVADTGASLGAFARFGWIYVGAFHHVAIELDVPDLDVSAAGSAPGSTSLSIGVALLAVTAVAVWLLWRAGRAVADGAGGDTGAGVRMVRGASVSLSYALLAFIAAMLVRVRTPLDVGAFASGELEVSLTAWQAFAFPLAIGAAAGAAGGLSSALEHRGSENARLDTLDSAVTGGWRMFALGLVLSLGALFVAGVVQPDEPVALLTPSTSRYLRGVFDRPEIGLVVLGHHVAAAPNEAIWTLVPAMGGCDGVRGSASGEFLCYWRFPTSVGTTLQPLTDGRGVPVPHGGATFGTAPTGYFLFLLVPAVATVLGGRRAAERNRSAGRSAFATGAAAGLMYALLIAATALLSTITVGYGAAFGRDASEGWIALGPNVVTGTLLALVWGVAGGVAGAVWAGRSLRPRASTPARRGARTGPR